MSPVERSRIEVPGSGSNGPAGALNATKRPSLLIDGPPRSPTVPVTFAMLSRTNT
jgi:hypothetical protein